MTLSANLEADLELMIKAAKKGGEIALAHHGSDDLKSWLKRGVEPVTQVDLDVDQALKDTLMGARPDYGWLSEESIDDDERLSKKHVWVVDPIDGTRAYINGKADFCIAIALLENNQPVLGVIYAPAMGKLYHGAKAKGAFLNDKPIRVSDTKALAGMRFQSDPGYIANAPRWQKPWPKMAVSKFQSFALRLAAFAAGEADAVLAARPKSEWDVAAAQVIINEAGGLVCDQNGQAFTYNNKDTRLHQIAAIGPTLRDEFLEIVRGRIPKNKP